MEFTKGQRVKVAAGHGPLTDQQGQRLGTVEHDGIRGVSVRMDLSNRVVTFSRDLLTRVE